MFVFKMKDLIVMNSENSDLTAPHFSSTEHLSLSHLPHLLSISASEFPAAAVFSSQAERDQPGSKQPTNSLIQAGKKERVIINPTLIRRTRTQHEHNTNTQLDGSLDGC